MQKDTIGITNSRNITFAQNNSPEARNRNHTKQSVAEWNFKSTSDFEENVLEMILYQSLSYENIQFFLHQIRRPIDLSWVQPIPARQKRGPGRKASNSYIRFPWPIHSIIFIFIFISGFLSFIFSFFIRPQWSLLKLNTLIAKCVIVLSEFKT